MADGNEDDELGFDPAYAEALAARRAHIMAKVAAAAEASGRTAADVRVCAVSKTVGAGAVVAAWQAGWRDFAENRPQELERKLGLIAGAGLPAAGASWHMIGNLQENKINHVLACRPALVHSIASAGLAQAVSKRAEARGMRQDVLLEVNVSGEQSKSGMAPDELRACLPALCALPGIHVRGLMTMAPQGEPEAARATFAGLAALRDELRGGCAGSEDLAGLSMGMSEDFEEAIRQGATIVRLGRVAFDPEFPLG